MSTLTTYIHVNPHYLHSCQPSLLTFMSTLTTYIHVNPHCSRREFIDRMAPSLMNDINNGLYATQTVKTKPYLKDSPEADYVNIVYGDEDENLWSKFSFQHVNGVRRKGLIEEF